MRSQGAVQVGSPKLREDKSCCAVETSLPTLKTKSSFLMALGLGVEDSFLKLCGAKANFGHLPHLLQCVCF